MKSSAKLNLGCGKDIREGFTNIDIRPLPGVDVVADVREVGIKADYILARDVLEHFPQAETLDILKHWISLLNPGGIIEIQCPDVLWAYEVSRKRGANWLIQLLYGGQDYPENFHKAGFTLEGLRKILKDLGLEILSAENTPHGNLFIKARRK
ncbi:MAG: methyltransferase domain-containing protein [Sphaerochaetaceae bacterium]|nr:methyltransferase domain-containing protein [Sphaerochaetaceae bacterium]